MSPLIAKQLQKQIAGLLPDDYIATLEHRAGRVVVMIWPEAKAFYAVKGRFKVKKDHFNRRANGIHNTILENKWRHERVGYNFFITGPA